MVPSVDLSSLTRKHGLKICPGFACSVEVCGLAVAKVVGAASVKSAARMNGSVVIFVDEVAKANAVIANGVVINDAFVPVMPLASPSKKVILSNCPPFVRDELLEIELSRHGKIVSPIKKVSSGCKSPLLQHVVSHRRQVFMILNDSTDLSLSFRVKVDGADYVIFATSDVMRCFACGKEGHIIRLCPERPAGAWGRPAPPDRAAADRDDAGEGPSGIQNNKGGKKGGDEVSDGRQEEGGNKTTAGEKETSKDDRMNEDVNVSVSQVSETDGASGEQEEGGLRAEGQEEEGLRAAGVSGTGDEEEGVQADADVDMAEDERRIIVLRQKRKAHDLSSSGSVAKKAIVSEEEQNQNEGEDGVGSGNESEIESEGGESVSEVDRIQEVYGVERVQLFLYRTKNKKKVKVGDFFPSQFEFHEAVGANMRARDNGGYTRQEVFRLRKILKSIREELNINDDGSSK